MIGWTTEDGPVVDIVEQFGGLDLERQRQPVNRSR